MSDEMQPGRYNARAVKNDNAEYEVSSPTKGTPGYQFDVIIEEGPHKGRRFTWNGWATDAALARCLEQIELAGARVNKQTGEIDWSGLGSTVFPIGIKSENGSLRADFIGGGFAPLPDAQKEQLRAKIAAMMNNSGATASKPKDEIPF